MTETIQQQMIRIAQDHGFTARFSVVPGSVEVQIPWSKQDGTKGIDKVVCHDLRSLKIALGY